MPVSYQIPQKMTYSDPDSLIEGELNYVQFQPVAGSSWGPSESFDINISSPDKVLDVSKSYLKFKLALTGTTTVGSSITTVLGGASAIQRVVTSVGGLQVEDIQNYPSYLSVLYKRGTAEQQNVLKALEAFNDQGAFSASDDARNNGRVICHALRTAVCESDKHLPLFAIRSGITFSFTTATLNDILTATASGATSYKISEVYFVGALVKPAPSYIDNFMAGISGGRSAQIPMQLVRNVRFKPSTLTQQETNLHIGQLKSLRQIFGVCRESTSINTATTDSYALDALNALTSYYYMVGSERYPQNKEIFTNNAVASGAVDPESVMQTLVSLDNTYAWLNPFNGSNVFADGKDNIFAPFTWASNRAIGSGVMTSDGFITINHKYNSAPAGTETVDMFIVYDAMLKLGATIELDAKNL